MIMKPRFETVWLSPMMVLSLLLMAISVPKVRAGSKPLGNEVVDGTVNPVTPTIDIGPYPDDIAVDPVRNFTYVSVGTSGTGNGEIVAIDTTTNAPVYTLFTGDVPNGMAVSPDGQLLYVTTLANTMQVFSLDLREFLYSYTTGNGPAIPAVSPDGSTVYVPNNLDQTVTAFEGQLTPVTMPVSGRPFQVVFAPDGKHAYVGHSSGLSVIDTSTHIVTNSSLADGGHEVAITPDGQTVYLTSGGNEVYAIATSTLAATPITTFASAGTLWGLALDAKGKFLYVNSAQISSPSIVITIETKTKTVRNQTTTIGFLSYEIAIKGKSGYAPNLFSDTVSVFKVK